MNTETRLYLSLRALLEVSPVEITSERQAAVEREAAEAMAEFENTLGPVPEWAVAHNLTDELVPGLQLFTKDGRHCGNAHIISAYTADKEYFNLLTDAGNEMAFSQVDLENQFYLGKFISNPAAVVARFGSKANSLLDDYLEEDK